MVSPAGLSQAGVYPLEHAAAGTQGVLVQAVQRRLYGAQVAVQVARCRVEVEQAGRDLAGAFPFLDVAEGGRLVGRVVVRGDLGETQGRAVRLEDLDRRAGLVVGFYRVQIGRASLRERVCQSV